MVKSLVIPARSHFHHTQNAEKAEEEHKKTLKVFYFKVIADKYFCL